MSCKVRFIASFTHSLLRLVAVTALTHIGSFRFFI